MIIIKNNNDTYSFPFDIDNYSFCIGFEGGQWDLIVLVPDHCLSVYFR